MTADLLRRAAAAEREEWGDEISAHFPAAQAIHLELADWLDDIARHWEVVAEQAEDPNDPVDVEGQRIDDTLDSHAIALARRILGEQP